MIVHRMTTAARIQGVQKTLLSGCFSRQYRSLVMAVCSIGQDWYHGVIRSESNYTVIMRIIYQSCWLYTYMERVECSLTKRSKSYATSIMGSMPAFRMHSTSTSTISSGAEFSYDCDSWYTPQADSCWV